MNSNKLNMLGQGRRTIQQTMHLSSACKAMIQERTHKLVSAMAIGFIQQKCKYKLGLTHSSQAVP